MKIPSVAIEAVARGAVGGVFVVGARYELSVECEGYGYCENGREEEEGVEKCGKVRNHNGGLRSGDVFFFFTGTGSLARNHRIWRLESNCYKSIAKWGSSADGGMSALSTPTICQMVTPLVKGVKISSQHSLRMTGSAAM